jgi:excinuclease ABC subunit A
VLDMTVEEGVDFFAGRAAVRDKLQSLQDVGLGYIKVGQQATTLSGGEAQRVKLAKELSKRATGRTLYILDEPTTGLHFHDVAKLLEVLHELVNQGNTVVVIEHNLEVIKTADWVLDFGPEGGDGGGEIVAVGTPEDIVKESRSLVTSTAERATASSQIIASVAASMPRSAVWIASNPRPRSASARAGGSCVSIRNSNCYSAGITG